MNGMRCWRGGCRGLASGWDGVEADGEAEGVGLFDDLAHGAPRVAAGEVVSTEVAVGDFVVQDVPDRDDRFVHDRNQGTLASSAGGDAPVVDRVVGVLLFDRGHRGGAQDTFEVGVAVASVPGFVDPRRTR